MVAIYAFNQKGVLSQTLDAKLADIERKQQLLVEKRRELEQAKELEKKASLEAREAAHRRRVAEQAEAEEKKKFDAVAHEKEAVKGEADSLRSRWHDEEDDHREDLEKLSTEELHRRLREDEAEFEREQRGLEDENLDGDSDEGKDLAEQKKVAKTLEEQWKDLQKVLSEEAPLANKKETAKQLERLEELGETNEVFLEDLNRDARKNMTGRGTGGGRWKERERPQRMQKLVKRMDEEAEVLRSKVNEKELDDSDKIVAQIQKDVKKLAEKHRAKQGGGARGDRPDVTEDRLGNMADEVAERERRLKLELLQADDMEAFAQAKALEEYALAVQKQVAHLEQIARNGTANMTPEELKEHQDAMHHFEQELVNIETHAQDIERGFERRQMRREAVLMAKAANALHDNKEMAKLGHSEKVYNRVKGVLRTESDLLNSMHGADTAEQKRLSSELGVQSKELEDDSEKLQKEADAGHFKELNSKVIAEAVAKAMKDTADRMASAAHNIEESEVRREIRGEGHNIDLADAKVHNDPQFVKVDPALHKVHDDVAKLDQVIGEGDLKAEFDASKKTAEDILALEEGAKQLEDDLTSGKFPLSTEQRQGYMDAIKQMRGHADSLRKYVKGVSEDVKEKAQRKVAQLKREKSGAESAMKAAQG